ncbi:MAG: TPM domain-containing protein [Hyphomicrobiales bacterium]|nr:TPM domain-containing protein [Hyphomicrobiales bacterium]
MSEADRAAVDAAIAAAEARTSAEIHCVLAESSGDYELPALVGAVGLALLVPWPMLAFTLWSAERVFVTQIAVFAVALLVLSIPAIRVALTPPAVKRAQAHRAAIEQFVLRGVDRSPARSGVLLFASLRERYARVIADEGAAKAIPQAQWRRVVDAMTGRLARGEIGPGYAEAASACGDLLAAHFPRDPAAPAKRRDRLHVV